jgi:uncharacterized repeat protein (TIGR02543 family)
MSKKRSGLMSQRRAYHYACCIDTPVILTTYTVLYNGNTNTSGNAPTDSLSPYTPGSTVTVLGKNTLTKTGYTFIGWNTVANGSGTSYPPTSIFTITMNMILYAQWTPTLYTVTYDGNTNTGGTAPTDGSSPYADGSEVTVLGNTGTLVKTGYTFAGWNTVANGTGTSYSPSNTFNITSDTTLYAKWAPIPYTVTYDKNSIDATGNVPVDEASPYIYYTTVTVLGNIGSPVLERTGYTFAWWNTESDGSGIIYLPTSVFTITIDTILYAQWVPIGTTYTVTYDENTSTGGTAPVDGSSPYSPSSLVTVLENSGSLVKTGYTFAGWDTSADGSGSSYPPSTTFNITSDTILYAEWIPIPYTVTYNGNTNTSGTAPVDGSSPYIYDFIVTVLGNTGTPILEKNGYTFAGWNTAADGSGSSYSPTTTFQITSDITLYAQWTPIPYTVTYNGNTNTSGTVPVDGSSPYIYDSTVTVLGNTGTPILEKTGYTFAGWNTVADGSGSSYSPTNTFTIHIDTTLYAQWTPIPYTVIYNGNTNTSGTVPVDGSSPYIYDFIVTVLGNTGTLVKTGYTFAGWNTMADGSGSSYSPTSTFPITSDITLYAKWTPLYYTMSYDGNTNTSGTAPVDGSSPYIYDSTITVLGNTGTLVKTGYTFAGWNAAADGSGTSYPATSSFNITSNTTLYAQWTPVSSNYTVIYNGNTNSSGSSPVDGSSPYVSGSIVTVLGNTGTLLKTGNTFAGWNTAADGSGSSYSPTSTFPIETDTTLYAQWTPIPYTVSYNGNTNTGGTAPVDGSSPYNYDFIVTVLGNTGTPILVKTGYTFAGWDTSADGSGSSYPPSTTFNITSDTILYAEWIPIPYTVTYNGNTNTGGTVPVDGSSPYIYDSIVTVLGNTGTLVKTGYTFAGWNTAADGSGSSYSPTSTFPIETDTTLYAQWTSIPYTVTYNGNTNTSGTAPVDGSSYIYDSPVTVLGNTGTPILDKTGYTFAGWNTAANGTGTSYSPSNTFPIASDTTLYAQWTPIPYTVTYNGNTNTSGTAPVDGSSYIYDSPVTVLGNTGTLEKTGYTFAGWNTLADGTGTSYSVASSFNITSDTTLYAKWTPILSDYTMTYNGNGNTSGTPLADSSSPYSPGSSVTVLGNTGSPVLAKTGYQFGGWNTATDGTGTNYVGGNTFIINANTDLYANWIIGGVRLLYNANAAAGGSGTAPSSSGTYYPYYSPANIVANTGFINSNGYVFAGWNTVAAGTGTSYPVGSTITMAGSYTLYAQWINPATTYTLTYDANSAAGGSGTAPNSPNPTIYSQYSTATILGNTGPYTNSDPTKTFYDWNTAANGTGTSYPAGSTLTMIANTTLYAQWKVFTTPPYTVTYDANTATGGSVPAGPMDYPSDVQVSILGQGSLTKSGYTFLGWNSSSTGAGSLYAPGYTFTSKTATLYAQWAPGSPVKTCGGGTTSSSSPNITFIFPYAMTIQSTDTITIYTTALLGTTTLNYGSGAAPLGIISIASKTVITQTSITINTNTTYVTSANDYNYSQTITNGIGVTYWPSGETITSVTFPTINSSPAFSSSPPTFNLATKKLSSGCGLTVISGNSSSVFTLFNFFVQGITLNYSNGANTQIITCPTSSLYTTDNGGSPIVWSQTPNSSYPYVGITTTTDNTLTAITIIPSTGSTYVNPAMPNYTVQYDPNGATGGNLRPPTYMSPYTATTSITIGGNTVTSTLTKTGFTFSRWNTAADGSGTNYGPGYTTTYGGGASIILYAIWV